MRLGLPLATATTTTAVWPAQQAGQRRQLDALVFYEHCPDSGAPALSKPSTEAPCELPRRHGLQVIDSPFASATARSSQG